MNGKYTLFVMAILMIRLEALERSFSDELDRGLASLNQSFSDESDGAGRIESGWGMQSIYEFSSPDSESNREKVVCADKGVQTELFVHEPCDQEVSRFKEQMRIFLYVMLTGECFRRDLRESHTFRNILSLWNQSSSEAQKQIQEQLAPLKSLLESLYVSE